MPMRLLWVDSAAIAATLGRGRLRQWHLALQQGDIDDHARTLRFEEPKGVERSGATGPE